MLENIIVVLAAIVIGFILFSKKMRKSKKWKATVTPLASIIGSGFLVAAPLMADNVGDYAVFAMAGLIFMAFLVGSAIRFNIRYVEPILNSDQNNKPVRTVSKISQITLSIAYFISVSYYLNLLSAFFLNWLGHPNHYLADWITTGILAFIGIMGWYKGLKVFENMEEYAVTINFMMIGGLIVGLVYFNTHLLAEGQWKFLTHEPEFNFNRIRVLLGVLIVVQGFETSRFLGSEYSADMRIKTMRNAQIISTIIYIFFIIFVTELFRQLQGTAGVTGIITVSKSVAIILPACLTIAAVGSQFSASIADTAGAGGLIEEVTNKKIKTKYGYLLIALVAITLTWSANVYTIICYASRAFALFYSLQCLLALIVTVQNKELKNRFPRSLLYGFLTVFCLLVVIFGLSSEG